MLKEKIVNFEREHRIVPKVISAASALSVASVAAITVSAEGSTTDIDTVTSAMTTSLTDLVGKVAVACAGVVGVALTIFGLKWVVRTVKSFFSSIAK